MTPELNTTTITIGIIIVISIILIIWISIKITRKKTSVATAPAPSNTIQIRTELDENGNLKPEFVTMLEIMNANNIFSDTSGQWKPIEPTAPATATTATGDVIVLFTITSDKSIIDPYLTDETIKATLNAKIQDTNNITAVMNYIPVSGKKYAIGVYSGYYSYNANASTLPNFSNVIRVDKVWLYKSFRVIHLTKIAKSEKFEKIFGNYAEYYLCLYFASAPYSVWAIGSGEYKE